MIFAVFALVLIGVGLVLARTKSSKNPRDFAMTAYWVYLPGLELPTQEALMHRMVAENPYSRPRQPAIGAKEGQFFTDIRVDIARVTRKANAFLFRPDMLADTEGYDAAIIQGVGECESLARLQFVCEDSLSDDRHLQFMPHLAGAICDLADGRFVFDPIMGKVWTRESFAEWLGRNPDSTDFDDHFRVQVIQDANGLRIETRGLRKMGHREMLTEPFESDFRTLMTQVMTEAGRAVWKLPSLPEVITVNVVGDDFEVRVSPVRGEQTTVRIFRKSESSQ